MSLERRVVAVIDDDIDGRETIVDQLEEWNYEAVPIVGPFGSRIDRLIAEVEAINPGFVICDNRLTAKQYASFDGIQVVERLIEAKRPAMLLTQYQETDRVALRLARSRIPVIKARDNFWIEEVDSLHDVVRREIDKSPVASRKPHRVLLRVEAVRPGDVDVVVPSWNAQHALAVPKQLLSRRVRDTVNAGDYLLGEVNIGALTEDELFFDNVDEIVRADGDLL